jgi:hypothetical protein
LSDIGRSPTLIGVFVGVSWFLIFLSVQVAVFQLLVIRGRFRAIVAIFSGSIVGAVLTTTMLAHIGWLGSSVLPTLSSVVTMACLWVLYMPFYYVIATSLSVRTLLVLASAEESTLPLTQLEARFASASMLQERLSTMRTYRNVAAEGTGFTLTAKGRTTAAIFGGLKRFWELGPGG